MKKKESQKISQQSSELQSQRMEISQYPLDTSQPKPQKKQKPQTFKLKNNQSLKNFAIIFLLCFVTFSIGGISIYVYNLVQESHTMLDQMSTIYKQLQINKFQKDKIVQEQTHKCEARISQENLKCKNASEIPNNSSNQNSGSGLIIHLNPDNPDALPTPQNKIPNSTVNNSLQKSKEKSGNKSTDLPPSKKDMGSAQKKDQKKDTNTTQKKNLDSTSKEKNDSTQKNDDSSEQKQDADSAQQQYEESTYKKDPNSTLYTPSFKQLKSLNYKKDLIIVTHAGRKVYLQILYKYLRKQVDYFFQWHLWVLTSNTQDVQYMQKLQKQNTWIKFIRLESNSSQQVNYTTAKTFQSMIYFYKQDCQQKKVYLKLDDDILWMDKDFVLKMFEARFQLIEYLLVFPNIINSSIHAHLQQRAGVLRYPQFIDYNCNGNAWKKPMIGASIHKQFLQSIQKGKVNKWRNTCVKWQMLAYERVSINALIYYSETMRSIDLIETKDDEKILTTVYPKIHKKPVVILGDILVVHGAYRPQRQYFKKNHPQILQTYQKIANNL